MKIEIRKTAIRDLKKIKNPYKELIHQKILELKDFPNVKNIKKLTNFEPALRIKEYRVLFDVIEDTIYIGRVLQQKESYKK